MFVLTTRCVLSSLRKGCAETRRREAGGGEHGFLHRGCVCVSILSARARIKVTQEVSLCGVTRVFRVHVAEYFAWYRIFTKPAR